MAFPNNPLDEDYFTGLSNITNKRLARLLNAINEKINSLPGGGSSVAGPASATDTAVALFDGTTGKIIKNSLVLVDGSGNITTTGTVDGRDVSTDGTNLDAHIASTANPHLTDLGNLGSGTLAELNALVTDATLDDSGDPRTPTGSAGGDLAGTYPNPTLTATPVTPGSYTSANITVDSKGRLTAAANGSGGGGGQTDTVVGSSGITNVGDNVNADLAPNYGTAVNTICQGNDARLSDARTPTGAAGGQLGGTYPSPDVRGIRETSGPTQLTVGAIADGEFLVRSGATLIGSTPSGSGDVVGPASATDAAVALFDGTTGKLLKNSAVTVDVSGNITTTGTVDGRDVSTDGTNLDAHIASTANPHLTDLGNLGSGTLAELNSLVTDATLDDSGDARTPTGAAGGDLTGTYPSPALTATTVTPGSYTSTNITVDSKGRLTSASSGTPGGQTNTVVGSGGITNVGDNVNADLAPNYGTAVNTICQGNDARLSDARTPTGAAGGDLAGTYPNPALTTTTVTPGSYTSANITVDSKGRLTSATNGTGGGGSVFTGNTYYVDSTYGNDATAAPEDAGSPFATIAGAISGDGGRVTALSSGDVVYLSPGTYSEQGLSLPQNTAIFGTGGWGQTIVGVVPSAAVSDILTLGQDCYVNGVTLNVPDGLGLSALVTNHSAGTNGVYNVNFLGDAATGQGNAFTRSGGGKTIGANIRVESGGIKNVFQVDRGVLALEGIHVPQSTGTIENVLLCEAGGGFAGRAQFIGFNSGSSNVVNAVNILGGTGTTIGTDKPFVIVYTPNIFNCTYGLTADSEYLEANFIGGRISNVSATINLTNLAPSIAGAQAAIFRITSNHVPSYIFGPNSAFYSDFSLTFTQETTSELDTTFNVFGPTKASFGFPERATEVHSGRGAPYISGMSVFTAVGATPSTDGGTFVDVTSIAKSKDGSSFSFAGLGAGATGDVIYFGSQRQGLSAPLKHWGLELDVLSGEGASPFTGEYLFEIWDGAAWVELSVHAVSQNEGYSYGKDIFWRSSNSEIIRYGAEPSTLWQTKSVNSVTAYWTRVRIVTPPSSSKPTFERVKLVESTTSVSPEGVTYSTGLGQFRKTISLNGNIWTGAGGGGGGLIQRSAANGFPNLGSTGAYDHKISNSVLNGSGDGANIQFPIPLGTCTAFPLALFLVYEVDSTGGTANVVDTDAIGIESSGNKAANPGGGITPTDRAVVDTRDFTTYPVSVSTGLALETTANKLHKVKLLDLDISSFYEEDVIALRVNLATAGTADLAVWSIVAEGVSHQDGKGIAV